MKICIVTSSFPTSPEDRLQAPFLVPYIERIVALGHEVTVFTQEREGNPRHDWGVFRVVYFPWALRNMRLSELSESPARNAASLLSLFWNGVRGLRALQLQERFDALLCCWTVPGGLLAALARAVPGGSFPPIAVWALGTDVYRYKNRAPTRAVLRWVFRKATLRYADGFDLCRQVQKISGLDCDYLATSRVLPPPPAGSASTAAEEAPDFLFVGRHDAIKGVDVLVEALGILKGSTEIPFRAIIVGDGPMTDTVRRKLSECGLSDRVALPGRITDEHLSLLYQRSRCLTVPSRSETLPLVIGEAIRFGKSLIVTDVGDMGQVIREYKLGSVVPSENPKALAEAMRGFLEHPTSPDRKDCDRLLEILSLEKSAEKLCRKLEEIPR